MAYLCVLGTVEIVADEPSADQPARRLAKSHRARRLLAALITRANSVVSTDWLAEAVWGPSFPHSSMSAIQNLISRLRAELQAFQTEEARLFTRPPGYTLELAPGVLDAWRFEDLLSQGLAMLPDNPAPAAERLDLAIALWHGPAYAEYAGEEFARAEAARLEELKVGAEESRAEADLLLGRPALAASRLETLTSLHPLREGPHARLMLALYRAGQVATALSVFQAYRSRLRDELGLDPPAGLSALQGAILRGDPALNLPAPTSAPPDVQSGRRKAPAHLESLGRPLLGRDEAVAELAQLLDVERLITLTGTGGVGKTSLARAIAAAVADRFPDGVGWCELSRVAMADSVLPALLSDLQVPEEGRRDLRSTLLSFLADRKLLLVLDNCEHLLAEVARLAADILFDCPGISILATSRTALRIEGELAWPTPPLRVPGDDEASPSEVMEYEAAQLFVLRAGQRRLGFELTGSTAAAVARLCRHLDGLPLAIELAAARMSTLSPTDLVERLDWRFALLQNTGHLADPRHATLSALVDWSYDLLAPDEQELFEVLTVFAGPFTLGDAESIALALPMSARGPGAVANGIAALAEQSMIVVSHSDRTAYSLLETLREYGARRLQVRPYAPAVQRAHAVHFTGLATATYGHLGGALQLPDFGQLDRAMDEFRKVYQWGLAYDLPLASELVGSLNILVEQKMPAEVLSWADDLLAHLAGDPTLVPHPARVYAMAAAAARFGGDLERAEELCAIGHALAQDDPQCQSYLRFCSADVAVYRGDLERIERLAEAETLAARASDHGGMEALIETCRLFVVLYRGDPVGAAAGSLRLQAAAEQEGLLYTVAWAKYIRGAALADSAPAEAEPLLSEALGWARQSADHLLEGVALVSLASLRARHGDPEAALSLFGDVVRYWRDRDDWTHQWTSLRNVLDLLVRVGRHEEAVVLAAGLRVRGAPAVGYGSDAARLASTWSSLAPEFQPDALEDLARYGRSMSDRRLVAFVLDTLDRSQALSRSGRRSD
jgi:predicted ATPase/DNA-binding SARP family transcriptional activator